MELYKCLINPIHKYKIDNNMLKTKIIKLFVSCFILLGATIGFSQDFKERGTIEELVDQNVPGYKILDYESGHLNSDTLPDLIAFYDYDRYNPSFNRDSLENPFDRPLLLYLGQPDGTCLLAKRNDKVVLCYDCGGQWGDPFDGITINNGYFTLSHHGGSREKWSLFITFKYSPEEKNWFLHSSGDEPFSVHEPNKVYSDMDTVKDFGITPFEEYNSNLF